MDMMKYQRDNTIPQEQAMKMSGEELKGKLILGVLAHTNYPEFTAEYQKLIDRLGREAEERERANNK